MSGGEGPKNMLPFCVCEELDPYMIFCLAHFQNLQQLSKVTEFNTDLNIRDRQTSSNVCLLKLKEKQHIKNVVRSQSMASLSQIPVLHFSVSKKKKGNRKVLRVLWTVTILNCPKVFIYTRAVKMFIMNLIVRIPPPCSPPAPKVSLHAQLISKKIKISGKSVVTFNAERKQK